MNPSDGDTPPQSPLFTNAPGASPKEIAKDPFSPADHKRIDLLKQAIHDGKFGGRQIDRGKVLTPYLLVRSFTGDNGTRPFNQTFWESPDIWTAVGDPSTTPAIPPTHGGTVPVGHPSTVYAHVWNLGRAPAIGVVVDFSWFNPSLAIDGAHAHRIGMTRVDLGPRNSPSCHGLVKCPKPWVPVMENGGHECLIVKVSGFGDAVSPTVWTPYTDRHVAQRNVAVVADIGQMQRIISRLDLALLATTRIEVTHAGAEAADAVKIVAPHLTLDPSLTKTTTLANLDRTGAVHALAAGAGAAAAVTAPVMTRASEPGAATNFRPGFEKGLLGHLQAVPAPAAGRAQVVRINQYDGAQLTGGYTLVIGPVT